MKFKPCCPECGAALEGMPFPLPSKGVGRCPAGGGDIAFSLEIDEDKVVVDISGNTSKAKKWVTSGGNDHNNNTEENEI